MDKVMRNAVTLNTRCTGSSASYSDILFIHGLYTNMAFWHPVLIRELGARSRLLMYDQRGHGYSDMPASGYTLTELAHDAAAVMDAYEAKQQTDIVAHSFGSAVAIQLARLYPNRIRSIVLLDARLRLFQPVMKLGDWPDFVNWRTCLGTAGERLDPDLELDFSLPLHLEGVDLGDAKPRLIANGFVPLGGGKRAASRYRKLLAETTAAVDYKCSDDLDRVALRSVECPILAIYGSRSPFFETLRALEQELPNCEVCYIDNGGHNFPAQFPQQTADLILNFLQSESSAGISARARSSLA